jgi:hypothetical protein
MVRIRGSCTNTQAPPTQQDDMQDLGDEFNNPLHSNMVWKIQENVDVIQRVNHAATVSI